MIPPVVLVTGTSRSAAGLAIITPPSSTPKSVHRWPARRFDHLADGDADRNPQRDRLRHRARHGQIFVRHRPVKAHVHQRLDVGNYSVDIFGQPARRNHAPGDHVHQDELVARRINIRQRHHAHARRRLRLQRGDDVVILLLDPDHAFVRAHQLHGHLHAAQKGLGMVVKQFLVLVQQRLALGRVGDGHRDLGPELHRRREATPTGPNNAEFLHALQASERVSLLAPKMPVSDVIFLFCLRNSQNRD